MQTEQEDNCRNRQINSVTRNCNINNWVDSVTLILSDEKDFHSLYDQNWFEIAIDKVEIA